MTVRTESAMSPIPKLLTDGAAAPASLPEFARLLLLPPTGLGVLAAIVDGGEGVEM